MLDTTDLVVDVDLESLTIGEMIDVEDIAGVPIGDLGKGGALTAKAMLAVVFISLRRDHPKVTLDDVKALDVSVLSGAAGTAAGSKAAVVPGKAAGSRSPNVRD